MEYFIELLHIAQSHRRKETRKVNFQKTTNFAPANNRNRTTETNSYNKKQIQFITNGGIVSIAAGFKRSLKSSTVATVSFTRPSGK